MAGPDGAPWEKQDQLVVDTAWFVRPSVKLFAEYVRVHGFAPLNFLSGGSVRDADGNVIPTRTVWWLRPGSPAPAHALGPEHDGARAATRELLFAGGGRRRERPLRAVALGGTGGKRAMARSVSCERSLPAMDQASKRTPTVLAASNTIAYRFPDFPVRSAAYGRSLESTAMGRNHHGLLHICDFPGNFRKCAVHRGVDLMR